MQPEQKTLFKFASLDINYAFKTLNSTRAGLNQFEIKKRLKVYGSNTFAKHTVSWTRILWRQITGNPLGLILTAAALVSFSTGDKNTGAYVLLMILISIVLGFWNEFSAEKTIKNLLKRVSLRAVVMRGGEKNEVMVADVVPGDVVFFSPGSVIAADLRLIEANDLEVDEAALTGESSTTHKTAQTLEAGSKTSLTDLDNIAFMGTTVTNGWGSGLVISTGKNAEFGKIVESTAFGRPKTEFQKGLSGFGSLIVKVIVAMTVVIFIGNFILGRGTLTSTLFALAIAGGLTPELLPVIMTVGLAHGAGRLAKRHVVSKQLIAIENLGNMDVLCTDKTGTLTEGIIKVTSSVDSQGKDKPALLGMSIICNSAVIHHKPIGNSIDVALWQHAIEKNIKPDPAYKKLYEEPFDYDHRLMYCVVSKPASKSATLIAKGSPEVIMPACRGIDNKQFEKMVQDFGKNGLRVIALASKDINPKKSYGWEDVKGLRFEGFITFADTPKATSKSALQKLHQLNVQIKVITGDNPIVTQKICEEVGMAIEGGAIILGSDIEGLSEKELEAAVNRYNVFARVLPEHKLRIIKALQRCGHTVGFIGDGINDVPSLHNADVGISVNTAIDVAKEAAQVVLLRQGLDVIANGVTEGRKTFMNTIKYILMGTGSNFGEMASTAGASFFLPFLPMSPSQILVENGLYDTSQLPIASDNVDSEALVKPKHWDIRMIYRFMLFFGALSIVGALGTYAYLELVVHASSSLFQTVVFLESITTEMVVVLIVRTSRVPFWRSRPSVWLATSCLAILGLAFWLPFSPLARSLNFTAPSFGIILFLVGLLIAYGVGVEYTKIKFLKRFSF